GLDPRLHQPGRGENPHAERLSVDARTYRAVQAQPAPKRLVGETELPPRRYPPGGHSHTLEIPSELVRGVEAQGFLGTAPSSNRVAAAAGGFEFSREAYGRVRLYGTWMEMLARSVPGVGTSSPRNPCCASRTGGPWESPGSGSPVAPPP